MAEDLEKEEKKETKKTRTGTKTAKTSATKKTTTKKAKKEDEKEQNVTEKKKRGRPAKKKEEAETETNKSSRLEDLTELMEKIEKETENQKSKKKTKKEVVQDIKDIEDDKLENVQNEVKDLTVKKNKKEIMINPEKLEKIEEEIKKQTTISEEKKNKINKTIFHNIAIANIVMLYFIFLILGYQTILPEKIMIDLQVFSIITIGIAIIIFEKAYKKDSSEYAIHGIETLFLAIVTLISIYIFSKYQNKFTNIMIIICYLFAIYYVAKSIIIYLKMKSKALKRTNDIHKIVKK